MDSAVAVVIGAVISGVVGVLVVFYQQRLVRRHEIDKARAARLSEFSAAGWTATLAISELRTRRRITWRLPSRAARIMRHCFNDPGYRGPLPTRYRGAIPGVTAHDNAISYEGSWNAGKMSPQRRM